MNDTNYNSKIYQLKHFKIISIIINRTKKVSTFSKLLFILESNIKIIVYICTHKYIIQ